MQSGNVERVNRADPLRLSMSQFAASRGRRFGQRQPPVYVTIKQILERYPDGQIFKEMIQNADDAGATTVWFYVDERQHGTSNLPHPELAKFQGPALVAANDARFTERDWEGIQKPQESIKAEDPFKVGRFGIGFNSVYHITDLPILVSGQDVGFLDPIGKLWPGDPGRQFQLRELQDSSIATALHGLANFRRGSSEYSHSIFRLPLRREASVLSKNIYTVDKVKKLLDALRKEAKYLLLFLKSVTKIEVVYIDSILGQNPSFSVSIDSRCLLKVNQQRSALLAELHKTNSCRVTNSIQFTVDFKVTVNNNSVGQSHTSDWVVSTHVGSKNQEVLKIADDLKIFPWVGVAFELSKHLDDNGRVFCFLPLPEGVFTNLPIHVNGTFSLNDNRRGLKWTSAERTDDAMSQWNDLLIKNLLPECYFQLLLKIKDIGIEQFYLAWPDPVKLHNSHWSGLLPYLYPKVLGIDCLWCAAFNCWIAPQCATFTPQYETIEKVVARVLTGCNLYVVEAPEIVWKALAHYGTHMKVQTITASVARREISQNETSYKRESTADKLKLLEFCLADEKYSELQNIALVPLANGQFSKFAQPRSAALYVCSEAYPRSLLPNLDSSLIDTTSGTLQSKLLNVAKSEKTQLVILNTNRVAQLLPRCFPQQWREQSIVTLPCSTFPTDWFKIFWIWVQNHDLSLFIRLPVLPVATKSAKDGFRVIKLEQTAQSSVVMVSNDCPKEILNALSKLKVNCGMLKYLPFVSHNELYQYVHKSSSPTGMLTAIGNANPVTKTVSRVSFSTLEAMNLQRFLSMKVPVRLESSQKSVLAHLSIFKLLNSPTMISIATAQTLSWNSQAILEPHGFQLTITSIPDNLKIFSRAENQVELFNHLKLKVGMPSTMSDLIQHSIFPMIADNCVENSKIDVVMKEIVQLLPILKIQSGAEITVSLSKLPFLPSSSGKRKAPIDLFDPTNKELKDLFQGQDVFPLSPFDEWEIVANLRGCGLQTSVKAQRLLDILTTVNGMSRDIPVKATKQEVSRMEAVLSYISAHPSLLKEIVFFRNQQLQLGRDFRYILSQINCLPVLQTSPANYPDDFKWKGVLCASHLVAASANVICCTRETLTKFAFLVGSQMYFVQIPQQLNSVLSTKLESSMVLSHFKSVMSFSKQCSTVNLEKFIKPVAYIVYEFLSENFKSVVTTCSESCTFLYNDEWIWVQRKKTFVRPQVLALEEHAEFSESDKLEPYLYLLPEDLQPFSQLFLKFGAMQRFSTPQILDILVAIRDDSSQEVSPKKQWFVVKSILDWLTDGGKVPVPSHVSNDSIVYVPVSSSSVSPQLENVKDVVFTDLKYLRSFHKTEDYKFIHSNVSHLARALGVRPLSKQLNISEAFGDVGPHESLVTRLKNILKDYHDGLTIIKELLQNADDAEATEVNICYDTRSHADDPNMLLFPGTAKCHGPSLVVHNNSLFSDDDFKNIEKLAGATKSDQHLKIGKFGLGFCSVYHITDSPSFVSRDRLYIFDPALKFLSEENQDRSRPGKCLRITEEIVAHSHQLDPYIGLFGFKKNQPYQGTMFRFPFRTEGSKLSSKVYDSTLIDQLETEIKEAGSKLLLFLQHVNRLTVSRINPTESDPTLILEIRREHNQAVISAESSLISSTFANLISIDVIEHGSKIPKQTEKWLVGTHRSTNPESKYRVSSAACHIVQNGTVNFPSPVQGEMFCFLPLAQKTGLPIHISSNFAVRNDRSGIHSSDMNSRRSSEADWNVTLMQTVVPEAIHTLLVAVRFMCEDEYLSVGKYVFSSLWPLKNNLKIVNPWEELVRPTYNLIVGSKLFYSSNRQKWMSFDEIIVLSKTILCLAQEHSLPECVVKVMESLRYPLVSLPAIYRQHFPTQNTKYIMEEKKFLEIFFKQFKNLGVSQDTRNEVLRLLLLKYAETMANPRNSGLHYLNSYLVNNRCIPCKPKGKTVKYCHEIVDPKALFSILYDEEDEVFPISSYNNEIARVALRKLRMISEQLPLTMVIERAKHIQELYKRKKPLALLKVEVILHCLDRQVKSANDFPDELSELAQIDFLPVMSPPKRYPEFLFWQGKGRLLRSCRDVISGEDNYKLVGSQTSIVCEKAPKNGGCSSIPYNALRALRIRATPALSCVVKHLRYVAPKVTKYLAENPDKERTVKKWIEEMCSDMCKFFETELGKSTSESSELKKLCNTPCLWTGEEFVSPQSVAIQWDRSGPILYKLPDSLLSKENLIKALGIQDKFSKDQLLKALESLYSSRSGEPIGSQEKKLVEAIVSELDDDEDEFYAGEQAVYLPDEYKIMRQTSLLVYNDAPWCKVSSDCVYHVIHHKIPRPVALKLGVKPIRSKALESYESSEQHFDGVEFGQHEELTQRIKTILNEYPFDITVIKELLQNADDAKAKKLYFILDKRNHATNKIPSVDWKDLQGPALLVWNDMGFSSDDLKGIQKLGLGSKRSKSESIGQFGIGFNCVYHLTDCPSFLTNGNTICILDPHLRYIPGATERKPGRMYDKVADEFWENWSDIKSSYLREDVSGCPMEVRQSGSLFRFPLRHNIELVKKSKLVDIDAVTDSATLVLSARKMEEHLLDWAQKMKDGLIFLNNVVEMKFFVITSDNNMLLKFHYRACLEDRAIDQRLAIQHSASKFTSDGDTTPTSVFYDITLSEEVPNKKSEKWVVKRGIGDSMMSKQTWQFLQQIRPNHGLATPVGSTGFKGNVFCFLPLPMHSNLPVHVNGNFILDAARSSIWQPRDLKAPDDKARWNENLIEAIASSYSEFVVSCQIFYVETSYSARKKIQNSCQSYYSIFPYWLSHRESYPNGPEETDPESASDEKMSEKDSTPPREAQTDSTSSVSVPEGVMKLLAEKMYKKLYEKNAKVHIVTSSVRTSGMRNEKAYLTEFHPLVSKMDPSNQVHFWESSEKVRNVEPILKRIGLHLSVAPIWLRTHFKDVNIELPEATPATVYAYYKQFHYEVVNSGEFPCCLKNTSFHTVEEFKVFSKYLLRKKGDETSTVEFPDEPWGFPLLLTADNQLCCFDEETKVIHTAEDYSSIFADSPHHFLHPSLREIRYTPSYFLRPSDKNGTIVFEILERAIPNALHNVHAVKDVARHFPKDKFVLLWKLLENERVFSHHLTHLVKEWAILLSTDGQGFSCSKLDQLLPVIPRHRPEPSNSSDTDPDDDPQYDSLDYSMYELLSKHGMPVLDITTCNVSICKEFCPQFSKPPSILSNMFHLHQNISGSDTLYTRVVLDANIQKIIMYLSRIHLAQDKVSLSRIKHLPLFCDINHQYQALGQHVYLWPGIVSTVGSDKWLHEHEAIFLPANGDWGQLGTGKELLQIRDISPLSLYTKFIFPKFGNFSHDERISHLKHIRDTEELFKTAFAVSKSEFSQGKNEAALFVAALQQLPCLPVNGVLKPLCEFCDPDENVFKFFPDNICFPPKELQNAEWLHFFRKIGLRTKPTKEEFIINCQMIANGKHPALLAASKILVEQLCYEEDWRYDEKFLREISNIPFVCAQKLPRLAWIKSPCPAKNVVMQGKKSFSLTTLRDSVIQSKMSTIVWTVRSIVEIPRLYYTYKKDEREEVNRFFNNIGIASEPSPQDVIQNLCNISQTEFSNVSLLHKYPNKLIAPKRSISLVDVVHEHFLFFNSKGAEVQLDRIRDIPCIPVCQEGKVTDIVRPVLVRPVGVVAAHPDKLKNFLPILNPLPNSFFDILPRLSLIGVNTQVQLEQVQYGLDTIKRYSQEPYDPNAIKVLKELLKELYLLLPSTANPADSSRIRYPLYLPDKSAPTGVLVDSKMLLFDDMGYGNKNGRFDTSQVQYSFMALLVGRREERGEYGFTAKDLFGKIPTHVQPHPLSLSCTQELNETCTPNREEDQCSLALKLKKACGVPHFAGVVSKILIHKGNSADLCGCFSAHLSKFLENIQVFTVKNLKVNVFLKLVDPPAKIGTASVDFWFQPPHDGQGYSLYIEEKLDPFSVMNLVENLSKEVTKCVVNMSMSTNLTDLNRTDTFKVIELMIGVDDIDKLQDYLLGLNINISDLPLEETLDRTYKPKIGDQVLKVWHHRLQSDINNYFRPQEMAALEIDEEEYIYLVVEYKIPSDVVADSDDGCDKDEGFEPDRYMIRVKSEDKDDGSETKIVSVIDLYKIFSVKELGNPNIDSTELVIWDQESESVKMWDAVKGDKLKDIMAEICDELRQISKIKNEDTKRKAIKAMYLKWHPDKNSNPLASKAFQFLQQQIQRLNDGKPLEDPREDWEPDAHYSQNRDSRYDFDQWDEIIRSRRTSWRQEQRSYQRFGWGSSASDWVRMVRVHREPDRAKAWFEQAEYDFEAMNHLLEKVTCQHNPREQLSTHVCFLACQVAEKSVKAGMFQVCGLQPEGLVHHKFVGYAGALEQERRSVAAGLQSLTRTLEDYYVKTRYPNAFCPHAAPSNKFSPSNAIEAAMVASQTLEIVRNIVN